MLGIRCLQYVSSKTISPSSPIHQIQIGRLVDACCQSWLYSRDVHSLGCNYTAGYGGSFADCSDHTQWPSTNSIPSGIPKGLKSDIAKRAFRHQEWPEGPLPGVLEWKILLVGGSPGT